MNTIAHIVKQLRIKNNFTQDQLSSFLNCPRELISYYETGDREIPLQVLEKLSDLLGIELEDFFEEDLAQIKTNIAFAFRADTIVEEDLEPLAQFKKIVKNYQKMLNIEMQ